MKQIIKNAILNKLSYTTCETCKFYKNKTIYGYNMACFDCQKNSWQVSDECLDDIVNNIMENMSKDIIDKVFYSVLYDIGFLKEDFWKGDNNEYNTK